MHTMTSNSGEVLTDAEMYQNLMAMNYCSFFIDIGYMSKKKGILFGWLLAGCKVEVA